MSARMIHIACDLITLRRLERLCLVVLSERGFLLVEAIELDVTARLRRGHVAILGAGPCPARVYQSWKKVASVLRLMAQKNALLTT